MGLDFSHCDAHWAYSGFNRFRTKIAAEAGIALSCMEGFAVNPLGVKRYNHVSIFGKNIEEKRPVGAIAAEYCDYVGIQPVITWDKVSDDIKYLLNHSDCDGFLTPSECRKVAPRIRELVKNWPDDDRDKINALLLANGMDLARSKRQKLKFC